MDDLRGRCGDAVGFDRDRGRWEKLFLSVDCVLDWIDTLVVYEL